MEPWVPLEGNAELLHRRLRYTLTLNLSLGPKSARAEEEQKEVAKRPGHYWVVEAQVVTPKVCVCWGGGGSGRA